MELSGPGPWLADKSALARIGSSPDREEWVARIGRGLVRVATVTLLEAGFSARSGPELRGGLAEPPLAQIPVEYLTPRAEDRAVEVQALLGDRGHHRAAKVPDLLVAAAAELGGLVVLHLDRDFELIAEVTGQPVERLGVETG